MKSNKILILIYIAFICICTGCAKDNSTIYNENIQVKGLTLKTSLIQTAYEMYSVNVENPNKYNEDSYKEISKDAQKHYKWLKKTYASMDNNMKDKLNNICSSYSQWDYNNELIALQDEASKDEILNQLIASKNLTLSDSLKEDIISFLDYFYDEYFESYFLKSKTKYEKKSLELNKVLVDNNIDIIKFMENVSGFNLKKDYKSVFYFSLNPFQTQVFKSNNNIISTIQLDISAQDILSICFYQYSQYIFDDIANNKDFIFICESLKSDSNFVSEYTKVAQSSYDFNSWCKENLIAGFSKYLDYRYCQSDYQFTSYIYDLEFYNYLRAIGFNSNNMTLKDVSINFYKDKVNTLIASTKK